MASAQARDERHAPQRYHQHFRRSQPDRECSNRLRETQQQQIGNRLTDAGRGESEAQRFVMTTRLCHGEAIERGADSRRGTGDVEQYSRDRHAEQCAGVHRCHEDQRLEEIHVGDQRQADRQRHRRCQSRHRMDGQADQEARQHYQPRLPGAAEQMNRGGERVKVDHPASPGNSSKGSEVAKSVLKQ